MSPAEREDARPVSALQLLALGVNGIVGVGIFFVPAAVAARAPGMGTVLVFLLTGLALLPVALTFATLGRRFDEDGGPVVFARAAFGPRAAFLVGWIAYVSAFFSTAAVVAGLTNTTTPALGLAGPARRAAAVLLALALAAVVASGLRLSARVWTTLTVLKLLPLVALVAALGASSGALPAAPSAGPPTLAWLAAALTVVFALQGFEIVPVIAGQVRSSARAVPFATVGSLLLAIGLYALLALACVRALPDLAASDAPLARAAGVLGGPALAGLVGAGTSVSALGIAFGMMVTTPRYLSSLAAGEHHFLGFDATSPRGVPLRAVALTALLVSAIVGLSELAQLFALSSIAVLTQYGVSAAALVVLARRHRHGLRPLDAWPAAPTLLLAAVLVAFGASPREALVAGVALAAGVLLLRLARRRA